MLGVFRHVDLEPHSRGVISRHVMVVGYCRLFHKQDLRRQTYSTALIWFGQ